MTFKPSLASDPLNANEVGKNEYSVMCMNGMHYMGSVRGNSPFDAMAQLISRRNPALRIGSRTVPARPYDLNDPTKMIFCLKRVSPGAEAPGIGDLSPRALIRHFIDNKQPTYLARWYHVIAHGVRK